MELRPVDLSEVMGVGLSLSVLLVFAIGLMTRFAVRPVTEALLKLRTTPTAEQRARVLEKRIALLEKHLEKSGRALPDADMLALQEGLRLDAPAAPEAAAPPKPLAARLPVGA